jgi:hypothetical protein
MDNLRFFVKILLPLLKQMSDPNHRATKTLSLLLPDIGLAYCLTISSAEFLSLQPFLVKKKLREGVTRTVWLV